jgi:Amt family ammonium transporter
MKLRTPLFALSAAISGIALAQGEATPVNSGDTSWILMSSALVLLMTPGLAFFYGGMVRAKNVVSTLFQNFAAVAIIGLLWAVCGYSLVFSGDQFGGVIGDMQYAFLNGVGQEPHGTFGTTIPHLAFMIFQCMFAIITPALITGAFAERVSFKAWLPVMALWSLFVYVPVAHWVWGPGGWIAAMGGLDFAGGMVVHLTAGTSALVAAFLFGKRKDFGKDSVRPYDTGMILLGTALLIFGWFGFNAGSALTAGGLASHAFVTTFLAACASFAGWTIVDMITKGKPSAMGAAIGTVAGLVVITPGAGFVSTTAAMFMGLIAGVVCNYSCRVLKEKFKLDDTLDVFGCHGVGGVLGSIMTAVFASKAINPAATEGLLNGGTDLFKANLIGTVVVAGYSMVMTFVIIKAVNLVTPVRVSTTEEDSGLDLSQHGESINDLLNVAKASR